MKINSYNPNFTGYTNIFAGDIKGQAPQRTLTLSVLLDNRGTRDLARYKELKDFAGMTDSKYNNEVLTVFYSRINKDNHFLFMNDKRLLWGEELKNISECLENSFQQQNYKELEKIHIKIYTFLADITRRIFEGNSGKFLDNNLYRTLIYTERNLTNVLSNHETTIDIIRHGLYTEEADVPKIAKSLNHKIAVTMTKFFK